MKDIHPLVAALYAIEKRADRATLGELRRSVANPVTAMAFVVPYLSKRASREEEEALSLVTSLFALAHNPGDLTLARALGMLSRTSPGIEPRFLALLNAEPADLSGHLRHAVALVYSNDLGLDYNELLLSVLSWGREDKAVQRAWAREFWDATESMEETSP